MTSYRSMMQAAAAAAMLLMGGACGSDTPGLSGSYRLDMMGDSMTFNFHDTTRVDMTMVESGETETAQCSYRMSGSRVTVSCPGGDPMTLTVTEGALETEMDGLTARYVRR